MGGLMTHSQPGRPVVDDLLRSLAAKEESFLTREFLAPAVTGGIVRVRIGGVVCRIQVEPPNFVGWGIFRPTSLTHAQLVRPASLRERRQYLELFPLIRVVLCQRSTDTWWGSAASFGDRRVQLEGLAPILLADDAQLFDCVATRYDGNMFWFDEVDSRRDPGVAAYLRQSLAQRLAPDDLARKGITAEERAAYEVSYWSIAPAAADRPATEARAASARDRHAHRPPQPPPPAVDTVAERLASSLSHAGARLIEYLERRDGYRVTFSVDGHQYTSSVNQEDLSIQVAGICLSGEDALFDLASLVGVLREAHEGYRS